MKLSEYKDSRLVEHVNLLMKDTWTVLPSWRNEAREMYAFECGDQWSQEDKRLLMEQNRPAITFNRVSKVIDAASGNELVSRQEAKYLPRNPNDTDPLQAEVWNAAARWFRDQCDAEDEESDAFRDMLVCGMGWTESRVDFDEDPDGMCVVERVDPLEMRWDMTCKRRNLVDGRWLLREKWVPEDEIKSIWPDAELTSDPASVDDLWDMEPHDADNAWKYEGIDPGVYRRGYNQVTKEYRLIEFQWWEPEIYERAAMQDGSIAEVTPENEQFIYYENGQPYKVKQQRKKFFRAFIAGQTLLEKGGIPGNDFSYKCITGKRELKSGGALWYGLMRPMKDPQNWANKFLSQMLHIFNSSSKGGFFYETAALADPARAREDINRPEGMIELNPGGLSKIQERSQFNIPANLDRLLQYAIQAIPDVSGVNMEFMGLADRQQAGVTEYARQKAAFGILAVMYDSLRRYRKIQGRYFLTLMQTYLSDGRLIRVMGPEGEQLVPLARQGDPKFDIVIDDQPKGPNQKTETWMMLSQLLPVLQNAGIPFNADLLDYLPLPASLTTKWKQQIQDPRMAEMQQALQQLGAENEELKLKRDERMEREKTRQVDTALKDERDRQRIDIERVNAETDRLEALIKQAKVENDRFEAMTEAVELMNERRDDAGRT